MALNPWFGKTENHIAAIQARGILRVSTIDSPLTYSVINGKKYGLDYELAQQFANYLGVKLKVTVRQNISQLFDDLDNGNADLLAAGLVYDSARVKNYQPGPMYYSVSQQLVYRVGQYRPRSLATVNENQLTIAPGHVVVNDLQRLKETKFPDLSWKVDDKKARRRCWKRSSAANWITPLPIQWRSVCFSAFIPSWPWRWMSRMNSP